jgi:excisionase family DNA binding protein
MSNAPTTPQPDPDFLTVKEVADRLRQSTKTVRRRIKDRKLAAIKDARLLVPISEFYAYVDKLDRHPPGRR